MYVLYLTILELCNPYVRWDVINLGQLNFLHKFLSWGDISNLTWVGKWLKISKLGAPTISCQRVCGNT